MPKMGVDGKLLEFRRCIDGMRRSKYSSRAAGGIAIAPAARSESDERQLE